MVNVLLTGGSGFLGHELVRRFQDKWEITIFSRDEFKQSQMKLKFPSVNFEIGDVRNKERLLEVVKKHKIDTIIHAAALKRIEVCETNPFESVLTNVIGFKNVTDVAVETGANLVAITTDKACKPVNVYGMCKAIGERLVTDAGFSCVRYGNVIGSRGSVIPLFLSQFEKGEPLTLTNPEMTRFLLPLEHGIETIIKALESKEKGVWVRKSPAATIQDIADCYSNDQVIIGERLGEKLHEVLISEEESLRAKEIGEFYLIGKELVNTRRVEYSSQNTNQLKGEELANYLLKYG